MGVDDALSVDMDARGAPPASWRVCGRGYEVGNGRNGWKALRWRRWQRHTSGCWVVSLEIGDMSATKARGWTEKRLGLG